MDTVNRAPSDHSWIQMYNISFNISVKYDSLNFPFSLQTTVPGLTIMLGDWKETLLRGGLLWLHFIVDQSCATFHTSQRTMGKSTCIQGWSSFTIPWKINNFQIKKSIQNTIQPDQNFQNVALAHLWNQIFLNPLQLGFFSAIFCHHRLFIEFMGEVTVLVIVQGTANTENTHQS